MTDMTKTITLTIEQARDMLGKDPAMDQLIRANFTEDELNPKPKYPKRWEDLGGVDGWYVDDASELCSLSDHTCNVHQNTFATVQQARSFGLIYPQLTQLMKAYRGEWVPNWHNESEKCCVVMFNCELEVFTLDKTRQSLSFPTKEIAQQFLNDHRELIEEFFKGM